MIHVVRFHDAKKPNTELDQIQDSSGSCHLASNKAQELALRHVEKLDKGDVQGIAQKGRGVTWRVYDGADCIGYYYTEQLSS